ncbi:tetratricopeptide repeat protein [Olivibacter sitiensis]|uniref:tetratricopeptide repeat protein n=1 Tax=Olivibacter sitiensis TaxID=376470 RepID=UPI0012FA6B54|nr:hypothetical protein [Olivibacter sitiensis]
MGYPWIFCLSLCLVIAACNGPKKADPITDCELAEELYERHGRQGSHRSQIYLDSAIKLCPSLAKAWREISVPYLKRGDYATWSHYMDRAVELEPAHYLNVRGWCKIKFLHDYEGGLDDLLRYDQLIESDLKIAGEYNLYTWMAFAKLGLGDSLAALEYFNKSIESALAKGEEWIGQYDYLYRGILKLELKNYDGAMQDFDEQIRLYDKLADVHYYKGLTWQRMGQGSKAQAALRRAHQLFTDEGNHISDPYVEMPWEIYLEDIDSLLSFRR